MREAASCCLGILGPIEERVERGQSCLDSDYKEYRTESRGWAVESSSLV